MSFPPDDDCAFLRGGGEMGERIRSFDWSATPLGPPGRWEPPLRTLVSVLLGAEQAMFLAWGPERILLYNGRYAEILGHKHPAALGRPFFEVWAELIDDVGPIMDRTFAGVPVHMDDIALVMNRHGYLEHTHFSFSYTPIRNADGAVAGVFCPCTETTRQVRSRRLLHEREARLKRLADTSPAMSWLSDDQNRCVYLSRAWQEFTGVAPEHGLGLGWLETLHPDDRQATYDTFLGAAHQRGPFAMDFRVRHADGGYRWVAAAARPLLTASGALEGYVGAFFEITDRKRAELHAAQLDESHGAFARCRSPFELLRLAGERIAVHLRVAGVSFLEVDEDGESATLFQHRAQEDAERPASRRIRLSQYLAEVERETLAAGRSVVKPGAPPTDPSPSASGAYPPWRADAEIHVAHARDMRLRFVLSVQDSEPRVWRQDEIDLLHELSARIWLHLERTHTEDALRKSERHLRLLSQNLERRVELRTAELERQTGRLRRLAGALASAEHRERKRLAALLHDGLQQLLIAAKIRLAAVGDFVHDDPGHAAIAGVAEAIDEAVAASRDLTRQLRPPTLYEYGLVLALQWLAGEMEKLHDLHVEVHSDTTELPMTDDVKALLFESIRELLFNVVKHAGVDRAEVRIHRLGQRLQIVVEDRGVGLDLSGLASEAPDGIGLFSVRERLVGLGGDMTIQSSPSGGTRVQLQVPLQEVTTDPVAPRTGGATPVVERLRTARSRKGCRVLVVDDHAIVRQGIANVLAGEARLLVVGEAADGREAIDAIDRHQPHVVLMDVNMPLMNGVEATLEIRRRWPGVRVVALSVQDDQATARMMLDAGASAFVSKADTAERMVSVILDAVAPEHGLATATTRPG